MSRTVLTILTLILALGLGSSWADQSPEAPGQLDEADENAMLAEELAKRLAERLSDSDVDPGILATKPPDDHGDLGIFVPERALRVQFPPIPMPERSQVRTCLAGSVGCDVARNFAAMPACLDPDDCPAYDAWKQMYRQPETRIVPADPHSWPKPELASAKSDRREDE